MEDCPTHTFTALSEYELASGGYYDELKGIFEEDLIDFFGEALPNSPVSPESPLVPSSSPVSPKSPVSLKLPSSLPLPPPQSARSTVSVQLLSSSPSAANISNVLPSVCRPAASSKPVDPLSPPAASVPPAPPRPVDTLSPPWLHLGSSLPQLHRKPSAFKSLPFMSAQTSPFRVYSGK